MKIFKPHDLFVVMIIWSASCTLMSAGEKLVLVYKDQCDRYSLNALYHEKYKLELAEKVAEAKTFANRILDRTFEDIQIIGTRVPNNEGSTKRQKQMYDDFTFIKKRFTNKLEEEHKNITKHWEKFLASNEDFLGSKKEGCAENVIESVKKLHESYDGMKETYQKYIRTLIEPVKTIVSRSLRGIQQISKLKLDKMKETKEEEEKAEEKAKEKVEGPTFKEVMKETVKEVSEAFLGNLTIRIIDEDIDVTNPEKESTKVDKLFLELFGGMKKLKNKVLQILNDAVDDFVKPSKEKMDLMRRNLYMELAKQSDKMYKERQATGRTPRQQEGGERRFQSLWEDDEKLVERTLFLMECY